MKRLLAFFMVMGIVFFTASSVFSGGIINKQNFSAEYLRTLNRNAATDAADVAVYNPAGVMKLDDGSYLNLSLFYAMKDYSNTIGGTDYESDTPSTIPGFFAVYKQPRWAGFFTFTIPAGGGTVEYDKGNATTLALGQGFMAGANAQLAALGVPSALWYNDIKKQSLEADSFAYGYTFGGAYQVSEAVSIALGLRYVDSQKEAKGSVTISAPPGPIPTITDRKAELDYEEEADGWGGIVGINITPAEKWNIGIRYETNTKLDYETKEKKDTLGLITDGAKQREDLPGIFAIGVSYILNPKITLGANLTYYLEKSANWEAERLKDAGDSYDLSVAFEYTFNPRLKGSLGYMYTDTDIDPDDMLPEAPELGAHSLCGGIMYEAMPDLNLNFALINSFYEKETTSADVELDKNVLGIGIGIQYKF